MVACFRYNFCVEICDFGINTTVASQFNSIWFRQFGQLLHHRIVQSCVCLVFSGNPNYFDSDVEWYYFSLLEKTEISCWLSLISALGFVPLGLDKPAFPLLQYFSPSIISRDTFRNTFPAWYFPAILFQNTFPLNDFSGYHFLFFTHHILVTTKYSHKWENCIPNRRW